MNTRCEFADLEEERYDAAWSLFKILGRFKVMQTSSVSNLKNWDGSMTIQPKNRERYLSVK